MQTRPPRARRADSGPFFTTVIKRAEAFKGVILEYEVKMNAIDLVYTGRQGGSEHQDDLFKAGYKGYFSCKECEVSVLNDLVVDFVDWKKVRDVTDIVRG